MKRYYLKLERTKSGSKVTIPSPVALDITNAANMVLLRDCLKNKWHGWEVKGFLVFELC